MSRDITLLPPQWIPTKENTAADFLSRHDMTQWMFMLDKRVFRPILEHFSLQPTLDAFACCYSAQLPRYMAQGPAGSGPGCSALTLGSCNLPVSSCPSPSKGDQEDKGSKDQGDPSVSPVAHSSVVGTAAGHDGGISDAASSLQDNPGDSGQLSCGPLLRSSGGTSSYRQEFCLTKAGHDLDEADLDFLSKHLAS